MAASDEIVAEGLKAKSVEDISNLVVDILRVSPWTSLSDNDECRRVKAVHIADFVCEPNDVLENLDNLLFDRLMIDESDLTKNVIDVRVKGKRLRNDYGDKLETRVLHYLFTCFCRTSQYPTTDVDKDIVTVIRNAIVNQAAAFFINTDIYPGRNNSSTVLDLFDDFIQDFDSHDLLGVFMELIVQNIDERRKDDTDINLFKILDKHYYQSLLQRFDTISLFDPNLSLSMNIIKHLISSPILAKVFVDLNSPWKRVEGSQVYNFGNRLIGGVDTDIQKTLLGKALSISCLPKPGHENFEYFLSPSSSTPQEHSATSKSIGLRMKVFNDEMHSIFYSILKRTETRNEMLNWIGLCLYAFRDRSKMWTNEMMMITKAPQLSDGFLLNFGSVLLMLCEPFSTPFSPKLLKIDSRYCKAAALPFEQNIDDHTSGIHMRGLKDETFLIPSDEELKNIPTSYNFMTEIFYCAHKALQIGFRSCHDRFLRIASDLDQIQRIYEDASRQATQEHGLLDMVRNQMDKGMTLFLNLKTALLQPDVVELVLKFNLATATWLTNLAMSENEADASKGFKKTVVMEDNGDNVGSNCLFSIPEFVIDNISDIIIFVRRFSHKILALSSVSLEPLMTLILVFMGSSSKMKNPHSRARLAEVLEALMPRINDFPAFNSFTDSFSIGEQLFTSHPQVHNLVLALLQVFVSIEMTGQSVAFEQKFQYRRPMYQVLKYLWTEVEEPHRRRMKEIAVEAENKIEDAKPPLFLRFINLLTNDAIFLLDEALGYMKKLRELQQQRSSAEWNRSSFDQRQSQEANYHHLGRLARFHNVIGADTINTLSYLTQEIKTIFCHHVMVHRIAAMLNYFLSHLVGSKKKDFKVKGMETEFEFKPAEIVNNICQIYVNLGTQSNPLHKEFCSAVLGDARSYTPSLLPSAAEVLTRTGKVGLAEEIRRLGSELNKISADLAKEEIATDDIPDEYLDPIMNTLMMDPVKLPSGYRLDRSTIARHLLSDQTDPFTRAPLTMEDIVADHELKEKIAKFIEEYNSKQRNNKDSPTGSEES